ncbi:MAG: non-specific endonuclease [Mucilaginibacter sp.]|nr:non-specific endonuclease [Mucilaginibacter sp.]
MKKHLIIATLLCCSFLIGNAQRVQHHSYVTYYNASKHEPDSVRWDLTPSMVNCGSTARVDKFAQDPSLPNSASPNDYRNSGYDKGHMFPYADAECNATDAVECFYMTNMVPQLHALNAGDWKTLETQERVWARTQPIRIISGGFGSIGHLPNGENIPESCWKAIFVDHKWRGWVMPNKSTSIGHPYTSWEVLDIKRFGSIVGLHL